MPQIFHTAYTVPSAGPVFFSQVIFILTCHSRHTGILCTLKCAMLPHTSFYTMFPLLCLVSAYSSFKSLHKHYFLGEILLDALTSADILLLFCHVLFLSSCQTVQILVYVNICLLTMFPNRLTGPSTQNSQNILTKRIIIIESNI